MCVKLKWAQLPGVSYVAGCSREELTAVVEALRPLLSVTRCGRVSGPISSQLAEHLQQVGLRAGFPTVGFLSGALSLEGGWGTSGGHIRPGKISSSPGLDCGPWIRSSPGLFPDLMAAIVPAPHPDTLTRAIPRQSDNLWIFSHCVYLVKLRRTLKSPNCSDFCWPVDSHYFKKLLQDFSLFFCGSYCLLGFLWCFFQTIQLFGRHFKNF